MASVEPIPDHAAAVADLPEERLLLIADYHAGFEAALRFEEGIELRSRAPERRSRLLDLLAQTGPDRLVVLGDLTHSIGKPGGPERAEIEVLFEAIDVPVTIAKGNHDGILEELLATDPSRFGRVNVTPPTGTRVGPIALVHGHTWPDPSVLEADVICMGHEHPSVRLIDDVGGSRVERVWLRGPVDQEPFRERAGREIEACPELIIFPAFNDLCGGTWVNVAGQGFLSPFLPAALRTGDVYLLDGTLLGEYREI